MYFYYLTYEKTRKEKGPADIHNDGFFGLSKAQLDQFEKEYQRKTKYASCKWCGVETSILKSEAHVLGVTCSEDCDFEVRQHYT